MRFEAVRERTQFAEFCAFPARLHPRELFVPPLRATLTSWWRGDVPGVDFFVVRDGSGTVVARTTLHTDAALDAKLRGAWSHEPSRRLVPRHTRRTSGQETCSSSLRFGLTTAQGAYGPASSASPADTTQGRFQLFGLTEFVDDPAVTRVLFAGITAAARAAGRTATFGPVALLPNQSGGVITSGHDERGFIDSPWNPAYYAGAYEAHGFRRRFEADTWICRDLQRPELDADAVFPFDDARLGAEDLAIHHGRPRHLDRQLPLLRTMLNASFAQLGYYTPIDTMQLRRQTDGLAWLLDPALLLYLTKAHRPIAFVLVLPDISSFVRAVEGDLGPLQRLRLLVTRHRYRREAVLVVKGTVPEAQGRGYMRLLSRELLRNLRARGYTTLRSTFVERDNPGSAAQYTAMGGRPLHGLTFYEGPA